MKIEIFKTIKHSLFLEENDIKRLFDFLKSKYKKVEITATCIDGTKIETDDINEIFNFYNPTYRKIKIFEMQAYDNYDERVSIIIGESNSYSLFFSNTAEIFITTREKDEEIRERAQEIVRMFREMKPSYDLIARISIFEIILILWGVVGLFISAMRLFDLLPEAKRRISTLDAFNYVIIILFLIYISTYPIDKLRKWLFPRIFFNLGNQKKELEKIKFWRKVIFEIFLSGLIVSIIASFINKFLIH